MDFAINSNKKQWTFDKSKKSHYRQINDVYFFFNKNIL